MNAVHMRAHCAHGSVCTVMIYPHLCKLLRVAVQAHVLLCSQAMTHDQAWRRRRRAVSRVAENSTAGAQAACCTRCLMWHPHAVEQQTCQCCERMLLNQVLTWCVVAAADRTMPPDAHPTRGTNVEQAKTDRQTDRQRERMYMCIVATIHAVNDLVPVGCGAPTLT